MAPADRLDSRPDAALAIDALRRIAAASAAGATTRPDRAAEERDASAAVGTATAHGRGHARGMASIDAANDRRASPVDATPRQRAARRCRCSPAARVRRHRCRASDSPAATPAHDRGIDALTASLGVGAASRGADPAPATTAASTLALATPVDAPDFAGALGVQVSVLVQDGVQQAELHLNPAETGPVSIHISLDGTAARVDFGADLAATRQAIERGLPELASALRDAGLTLAGGGVSQHAGGRASGDDDAGARRRGSRRAAIAAATRSPPSRDASCARSPPAASTSTPDTAERRRGAVWARKASLIAASRAGPVSIISLKARAAAQSGAAGACREELRCLQ